MGYGFVLVPMAVFLLFFIFPIGYAIYISFYDWGILGKIEPVGLGQLPSCCSTTSCSGARSRTSPTTRSSSSRARWRSGSSSPLIVNNAIRGRAFFRAAYYFPSLASSAAITAIAIYLLNADGLSTRSSAPTEPWFGDSDTALGRSSA